MSRLPKPRSSAANTSARPSASQTRVRTPPDFRIRRLASIQLRSVAEVATCAILRAWSGEARCRAESLKGGFISTTSTLSGDSPAAAKASAADVTSSTTTSAAIAFAAALPRARDASSESISTRTSSPPATRVATARPAAPTPAPKSTTRSPERAGVAAASSMASWPARWPDFGCRRRSCPPRNASSVNSPAGSVIGPQFVGKAGIAKKLTRRAIVVVLEQNTARQDAKRAFNDAHVLIQHQMMDIGAVEQGADSRNQHHIVGSKQFPQLRYSFFSPGSVRRCGCASLSAARCPCRVPSHFLLLYPRRERIGQMWRPAWRLLYPSRAPRALR